MLIDATIHKANALVIDANANARSLITAQLRELGIGFVRSVNRVKDARIVLENAPFDLVVCDYHFEGHEESGQDLLDELRREQLLPYSTVFMMITAEATYAKVAEAAEAALDGYLIKPYTLMALAERVQSSRHRKRVLGPIFEAIEAQDFERAAGLCMARFEQRQEFWLFAARIGAELLLRLRRHDDAKKMYEAIIAAKTVPWAKLGVARADLEAGNLSSARRTLENLIGELPDHADSHDVLGRVHMEQGDLQAALATYRTASELTPGCLMRMQRSGTLSFYSGERNEALKALERAVNAGSQVQALRHVHAGAGGADALRQARRQGPEANLRQPDPADRALPQCGAPAALQDLHRGPAGALRQTHRRGAGRGAQPGPRPRRRRGRPRVGVDRHRGLDAPGRERAAARRDGRPAAAHRHALLHQQGQHRDPRRDVREEREGGADPARLAMPRSSRSPRRR